MNILEYFWDDTTVNTYFVKECIGEGQNPEFERAEVW